MMDNLQFIRQTYNSYFDRLKSLARHVEAIGKIVPACPEITALANTIKEHSCELRRTGIMIATKLAP